MINFATSYYNLFSILSRTVNMICGKISKCIALLTNQRNYMPVNQKMWGV